MPCIVRIIRKCEVADSSNGDSEGAFNDKKPVTRNKG